jgi:poly-gamma-glutamate capsule biosynthesis protein CapA/YwtB (metallophosphatase superfamily)
VNRVSARISRRQFVTGTAAAATALAANRLVRASSPVTVVAAGDCIITRPIRQIADPDFLELVRLFQGADVGFANCEMTFHDLAGYPAPTGDCGDLNLFADPVIAADLAWSGMNLMTVANNHGGDYGPGGLLATLEHLHAAGITTAGGGANLAQARAPKYRSTAHGRVALVACASSIRSGTEASAAHAEIQGRPGISPLRVRTIYGVPAARLTALRETQASLTHASGGSATPATTGDLQFLGNTFRETPAPTVTTEARREDVDAIVAQIHRARAEADVVLVTIHAHESGHSREDPASFLQPFARACIDAGAHAFFGHGPHVLRGIELYRGRPIFYSLGNFYFQAETIRQIPEEIYANCGIDSLAPSDFFKKVMGRMFEADVYWEALAPRLVFDGDALVSATLYPVDLRRHMPATIRGTPCLARGAAADRILRRQAELSRSFGATITIANGVGTLSPNG